MSEAIKTIIGKDLYKQVTDLLGDSKIDIISDNYIPKSRFDQKIEEVKLLKEKTTTLEKQITDTSDLIKKHEADNKGNETLKTQLEELKKQNEIIQGETTKQLKAKDSEISNIQKASFLQNALKESGCMHPDLLLNKFDLAKLEIENDKIKGIDDTLKGYKEKYSNLFTEKVPPQGGNNPNGGSTKTPIQQLNEQLVAARTAGNTPLVMAIKDKIMEAQQTQ